MMKHPTKVFSFILFLVMYTPGAFAQQGAATTDAQQQQAADAAQELSGILPSAGDQDAVLMYGNQAIGLSGAQEEEGETTYRYDGDRGPFYGVELPQRNFNNIDYPY